jgi:hypothetical protein
MDLQLPHEPGVSCSAEQPLSVDSGLGCDAVWACT